MNSEALKKLAQHLKNPQGLEGIKVAENMNISNAHMISQSILYLDIKPGQTILEIGYANGKHVQEYFKVASNINFYGLETSDTMRKEAQKHNKKFLAKFFVYDGIIIPFDHHYFDRIISVNTLYFWSNPVKLLSEIEQTLKPKGQAVITFVDKTMMQELSFVGEDFMLYSPEDFIDLVAQSKLKIMDMQEKREKVQSKSGRWVERKYYMFKLSHA